MRRLFALSVAVLLIAGCNEGTDPTRLDLAHESAGAVTAASRGNNPTARPLKMSRSSLELEWAIERDQELACGGQEIAGGSSAGTANFSHLGVTSIAISAAWDIGNQLPPNTAQFEPVGPVGGPVAPVLGPADYPYDFQYNPFTGACGSAVSATGEVTLTAANGDQVFGVVSGGETHRLDFVLPGDGVETFALVEITGGTGRFVHAAGSFVTHTVSRFDFQSLEFVIDLAEVLPGGTISY